MSEQVGREVGGYVVIAVPGAGGEAGPMPRWSFHHFSTRDDALQAAQQFTEEMEGNEAYVLAAEAHYFSPGRSKL